MSEVLMLQGSKVKSYVMQIIPITAGTTQQR